MKMNNPIKTALVWASLDLLKGIAIAITAFIGLILGGMVSKMIGLPTPGMPVYLDAAKVLPLMFISTIPAVIVLGECFRRLPYRYALRALLSSITFYILFYLANLLDAFLFSPLLNMSTSFFSDLFPALLVGLITAWLWKPVGVPVGDLAAVPANKLPGLVWRTAAAWLGYAPIYYLIGLCVAPFTKSYYQDPSHSLGLVLPPLSAILLMQVARGGVFLAAALPVLFGWRGSRRGLWAWIAALIFFNIATPLLIQSYWLPLAVRIPHVLELLVDSCLQAALYAFLLSTTQLPAGQDARAGHPKVQQRKQEANFVWIDAQAGEINWDEGNEAAAIAKYQEQNQAE